MKRFELTYQPFGSQAILINWPSKINDITLKNVLQFKTAIEKKYIKQKVYIKHAYCSLLVYYTLTIDNTYDKISELKALYLIQTEVPLSTTRLWKIPVCYNSNFGIDLEELSLVSGLPISKIISLHSQAIYTVYFIGFLPGFLYLGGLDEQLHFPRRSKPRLNVSKGAVGIGGHQTGIYPNESPGGWNLIGHCPLTFFDTTAPRPCFAKPGDQIKFYPISKVVYDEIDVLVKSGVYQPESEVIYG